VALPEGAAVVDTGDATRLVSSGCVFNAALPQSGLLTRSLDGLLLDSVRLQGYPRPAWPEVELGRLDARALDPRGGGRVRWEDYLGGGERRLEQQRLRRRWWRREASREAGPTRRLRPGGGGAG
jgi:hypothetical protein